MQKIILTVTTSEYSQYWNTAVVAIVTDTMWQGWEILLWYRDIKFSDNHTEEVFTIVIPQ